MSMWRDEEAHPSTPPFHPSFGACHHLPAEGFRGRAMEEAPHPRPFNRIGICGGLVVPEPIEQLLPEVG